MDPLHVEYPVTTTKQNRLISLIVKQQFGNSASQIASYLCQKGGSTLADLISEFKLLHVRKILVRLLNHQCILYSRTTPIVYKCHSSVILKRIRFPLYMEVMDDLYGKEAVDIFQAFCENGSFTGCGKIWDSLVLHHFVIALEHRYFDDKQHEIDNATSHLTFLSTPKDKLNALSLYEPPKKKMKTSLIYQLNFSRFDVELRNNAILKSITLNRQTSLVLKAILDVSASHLKNCYSFGGGCTPDHISKKITPDESKIYDAIHSNSFSHEDKILAYFDILTFHGFLYKSQFGQTSKEPILSTKVISSQSSELNDQFYVAYRHLVSTLQQSIIENSIRSRLGNKAVRVYKAMQKLKNADEKMIMNEAMLPSSETRQILFALSMSSGMATYGGNEGGIVGGYALFDIIPIYKSSERSSLRGHYLYSLKSCEQLNKDLLDSLYQFEYNLLARLLEEERKHRIIELRLNRGEIELGEHAHKSHLNFQSIRKRLWDSICLTDLLVATFRDY